MEELCKQNCLGRLNFEGEVFLTIYPGLRIIHLDYTRREEFEKSFFCDFGGNIICSSMINNILKNQPECKRMEYFFYRKFSLVFWRNKLKGFYAGHTYLRIIDGRKKSVMQVLYSDEILCVGVIESQPGPELAECLELLPTEAKGWHKLIIKDEKIEIYD